MRTTAVRAGLFRADDRSGAGKDAGGTLVCGDFTKGLAAELKARQYDAIVATYSLHHLTDEQKIVFIRDLLPLLREGGWLYIGDVACANAASWRRAGRSPVTAGTTPKSTSSMTS